MFAWRICARATIVIPLGNKYPSDKTVINDDQSVVGDFFLTIQVCTAARESKTKTKQDKSSFLL